jgi:hypothetical protein
MEEEKSLLLISFCIVPSGSPEAVHNTYGWNCQRLDLNPTTIPETSSPAPELTASTSK